MNQTFWPNNKKFCFTIIDDTDNSYLNNAPVIYEYLSKKKKCHIAFCHERVIQGYTFDEIENFHK